MVVMTVIEKSREPAYDQSSVESSYLPSQPFLFVALYTCTSSHPPTHTELNILSRVSTSN